MNNTFICSGCLNEFFFPTVELAIAFNKRSMKDYPCISFCGRCSQLYHIQVNNGNAEVLINMLKARRIVIKKDAALDHDLWKELSEECVKFRQDVWDGFWLCEFDVKIGEWLYRKGEERITQPEYIQRLYDYATIDEAYNKLENDSEKIYGSAKEQYIDKVAMDN